MGCWIIVGPGTAAPVGAPGPDSIVHYRMQIPMNSRRLAIWQVRVAAVAFAYFAHAGNSRAGLANDAGRLQCRTLRDSSDCFTLR